MFFKEKETESIEDATKNGVRAALHVLYLLYSTGRMTKIDVLKQEHENEKERVGKGLLTH